MDESKTAVVEGMAKWIERNVLPLLVPTGVVSVGLRTALKLAKSAPELSVRALSGKFPFLPALLAVGGDAKVRRPVFDAVKASIEEEPDKVMHIQFSEVGLFRNTPHSLCVTPALIDELDADIRAAEATLKAEGGS